LEKDLKTANASILKEKASAAKQLEQAAAAQAVVLEKKKIEVDKLKKKIVDISTDQKVTIVLSFFLPFIVSFFLSFFFFFFLNKR
jgi:hypothetical protein